MQLFLRMSKLFNISSGVWCLDYKPTGDAIASAGSSGICKIWDPNTKTSVLKINAHKGFSFWVKYSKDGN